ncbi:MAG: HAD-IA family hydrolase [Candidatus Delongbacteria bacterium]|nr:HAD-IA family hydrolase [Candidatus Delongbacteria bacterium]MBN2836332.1 HAD-IA family hydrolase [Candidatus Delongbacteria bacterium]
MSKIIITDLGNVIVKVDFDKLKKSLNENLRDSKDFELIMNLNIRFNKGGLTPQEFYNLTMGFMTKQIKYSSFVKLWTDIFKIDEEMCNFYKTLKNDGYNIILASNTDPLHYQHIVESYDLSFLTDSFLSYENHAIKPDQNFFTKLIEKYELTPESSIFIDDLKENIVAAEKAALTVIHHTDNKNTIDRVLSWLKN